jgi:hypothetical protein
MSPYHEAVAGPTPLHEAIADGVRAFFVGMIEAAAVQAKRERAAESEKATKMAVREPTRIEAAMTRAVGYVVSRRGLSGAVTVTFSLNPWRYEIAVRANSPRGGPAICARRCVDSREVAVYEMRGDLSPILAVVDDLIDDLVAKMEGYDQIVATEAR